MGTEGAQLLRVLLVSLSQRKMDILSSTKRKLIFGRYVNTGYRHNARNTYSYQYNRTGNLRVTALKAIEDPRTGTKEKSNVIKN
jgi:hypothetical protein